MHTANLNTLIDKFNVLLWEEKEFAMEIIKKAYAEARREEILKSSRKALSNMNKGKVKQGKLKDLYNDLEND